MARSVASAATGRGLGPEAVDLVRRAYEKAMEPRVAQLDDDHHPRYLHPGRTVLLLLRDVGPLDAAVLAAAALHESEDESFRTSHDDVRALDADVAGIFRSIPLPGDERLVERLVLLDEGATLAALAERLDHLRHAHLHDDRAWWAEIYEETAAAWAPVAERTHARLADRYGHWLRTFRRRLG